MEDRDSPHELVSSDYFRLDKNRGMATASLVLGVVSCLTLSLGGIGALTALALGVAALYKARKQPDRFDGSTLAVAGILTSLLSLLITFSVAAYFLNSLYRQAAAERVRENEVMAVQRLRKIVDAEILYFVNVSNGSYGTIEDLRRSLLIDHSSTVDGYNFEVSIRGEHFEVLATPEEYGQTGRYSFCALPNGRVHGADRKGQKANAADPLVLQKYRR